jgi:hypothetical protein
MYLEQYHTYCALSMYIHTRYQVQQSMVIRNVSVIDRRSLDTFFIQSEQEPAGLLSSRAKNEQNERRRLMFSAPCITCVYIQMRILETIVET